ncbi:family 14 glycosylhydrolase [Paenibacillus mucilaginosus]|uniref:beta-amylase n=1 Tax=Paenibacillus mucilaginosus (strain KNP414) TaxID=1036673 RepID=F8FL91_PAEMK|nr:family 14 glycosylhydrolase [Paenibacillus mucilaginosus]AEI40010.1 Beta/alpha-amylase [Paenibacillus mucilaginosus KNP414]MCG7216427.1 family 14 glycosylhydrolase [Paenibacillus mucilaginosus]WDM29259.1 family 14 glycosylhydrolase [Paenibacillus mucilaginosus]
MSSARFLMKKASMLLLSLVMLLTTVIGLGPSRTEAAVASDFQASVMGPLAQVTDWNAFKNQLRTLKSNGVYAITTDVWWGLVESAGDNQFNWSYYQTYASAVREAGLKWVPILSTHKCGGNVGDDCNIPLPAWLWNKGTADEMQFKSETGYVNNEAVSPFWSGIGTQYSELYASFASTFAGYKDIIPKIYLSGGPSGELRYPSYYPAAGWSYPSRGKFQVYTETAKNAFRTAMTTKYGSLSGINSAWGTNLTSVSQINPPTDGDGFYTNGGYNSTYGKDFLRWYQSVLENHLGVIGTAAHQKFDSVFGVPIGAKVSGVHWQMSNPTMPHSAEQAAGYYDYNTLLQKFKDTNLDLTFTCLEMFDNAAAPNYSQPSTLVDTVSAIANAKGVRLNGENALPASGTSAFGKIQEKLTRFSYNGFTLLRLANVVNADGSVTGEMANFKNYVVSLAKPVDTHNLVTIYYKKGFATPYLHYRPAGGTWTTAPGLKMADSEVSGYAKATVDIGSATQLEAAFNDGNNTWDSNATKNYFFGVGTFTYTPGANGAAGTITQGPPPGGGTGNSVTVYYKKGFTTPYIHYRPAGGTWTTAPGVRMADAEVSGYAKATVEIGTATQLEAAFNDGNNTWDSNAQKNYFFGTGTFTYTPGANGAAGTITQGAPTGSGGGDGGGGIVTPVDWSTRSIYFIMTDRFVNGDTSNDNYGGFAANKSDPGKWHGGDFQGIINNLDYIKNMGFNAIWITPVTMQKSVNAYHGYHTYDFYAVDGHLGTMEKFQELVKTAHAKNIAVMLDVVLNHTGDFQPSNGYAKAPFDKYDWYHHNGEITSTDYNQNNQWKIENGDVAGLDDLNHENTAVTAELNNWIQWLIAQSGVDGLRVDTAKHVPKSYLKSFDTAANTFTFSEVFHGDPAYVGDYSNYLDAALDFPMYYTIRDVFGKDGSPTLIRDRYTSDSKYRDARLNGLFLDNHDVKRFLNEASGNPSNTSDKWPQLKAALGFLFTSRGIPIVYQGTELGYSGGDDPANREDVVPNANHDLYKYIAKLNGVRNSHPALQNGTQKEKWADSTVYGFQRSKNGDEAVVLINNSWSSQTRTVGSLDNLTGGTTLRNQLGTDSVTVNNGSVTVTLAPKEVKIFTK